MSLIPEVHGHWGELEKEYVSVEEIFQKFNQTRNRQLNNYQPNQGSASWWKENHADHQESIYSFSSVLLYIVVTGTFLLIALYFTIKTKYKKTNALRFIDMAPKRYPSIYADLAMLGYRHYYSEICLLDGAQKQQATDPITSRVETEMDVYGSRTTRSTSSSPQAETVV